MKAEKKKERPLRVAILGHKTIPSRQGGIEIVVEQLAAVSSSFFATLYSAFGRYDVVHIHAEGPAFFCWLPKLFGQRVINTVHGECEIIWTTRKKPEFMRVCAA